MLKEDFNTLSLSAIGRPPTNNRPNVSSLCPVTVVCAAGKGCDVRDVLHALADNQAGLRPLVARHANLGIAKSIGHLRRLLQPLAAGSA
jgi:hypothetical protein